jgi:hypothetical protein
MSSEEYDGPVIDFQARYENACDFCWGWIEPANLWSCSTEDCASNVCGNCLVRCKCHDYPYCPGCGHYKFDCCDEIRCHWSEHGVLHPKRNRMLAYFALAFECGPTVLEAITFGLKSINHYY